MMRFQNDMQRKKERPRWLFLIPVFGVVLLVAFLGIRGQATDDGDDVVPTEVSYIEYGTRRIPSVSPAEVNYPAPDLVLTSLDGEAVSLADFRGQVLLVNQWAIFCPFCEAEMPEFAELYANYREQGFHLVGVNVGDPREDVLDYIERKELAIPVLLDEKSEIFKAFKNNHLPSSYVIDREGVVRLFWAGPVSLEIMEQHIPPLLNE